MEFSQLEYIFIKIYNWFLEEPTESASIISSNIKNFLEFSRLPDSSCLAFYQERV